ncbi:MAG: branched-chain amino acid ABC transporter permease, partial [Alphaproteobacteria bacterium]|nr:branched-chain amino acid ABC transporter permease [Alphaproteobacteria bacterium]
LGGFDMPIAVGLLGAVLVSGVLALLVGLVTLNLRTDYLAIATIGIAEIVRLFLKNEDWLTNGVRGVAEIPKALSTTPLDPALADLLVVLAALAVVYGLLERGRRSPWGRVLRAIRESEPGTQASGKNVFAFRIQAFVLGSMAMGLSGALYAHFTGFISPEAFDPEFITFLVWVMLIAGGSANNRGAVLGAMAIWAVWAGTEFLTGKLPAEFTTQAGALRIFLIGVLVQGILLWRPEGLLPERQDGKKRG